MYDHIHARILLCSLGGAWLACCAGCGDANRVEPPRQAAHTEREPTSADAAQSRRTTSSSARAVSEQQAARSTGTDHDESLAVDDLDTSFGIGNTFSGKLSKEQERLVPAPLRGAFAIESLKTISAADLAKERQWKTEVASESRNGKRYVALQDLRCVQFSNEVSGEMIVIERYLVLSK